MTIFKHRNKENSKQNNNICINGKESYDEILSLVNTWRKQDSGSEIINLLDYLIDVILTDVCTRHISDLLYQKEPPDNLKNIFPFSCFNEDKKELSIITNMNKEVDLSDTKVYVCPWHKKRLHDNLLNINKNNFEYDETNHRSYYFTDIDFCYVYNGNHSIHAGIYYKKGKIISKVCKTELLYLHCKTDGLFWYNAHTNEKIMPVTDFRIAAVFSIAQIRNHMRSAENT